MVCPPLRTSIYYLLVAILVARGKMQQVAKPTTSVQQPIFTQQQPQVPLSQPLPSQMPVHQLPGTMDS